MIVVFLFYSFNPESVSIFPKCPFLFATGYKCPGCGTQRAIHNMLHFRFMDAIRHNVFIVFAIPYIFMGAYIEYFGGKDKHPKISEVLFGRWSAVVVLAIVIVYWIGRNLV